MHQSIQVPRSVLSYAFQVLSVLVWLFDAAAATVDDDDDDDGQMKYRPSLSLNLSEIILIFYLASITVRLIK